MSSNGELHLELSSARLQEGKRPHFGESGDSDPCWISSQGDPQERKGAATRVTMRH